MPLLEVVDRLRGVLVDKVRGDLGQSLVHRGVGRDQDAAAGFGELEVQAPAVGRVGDAHHEIACDEAVDDGGDARRADGQAVGEPRRRRGAAGEQREHPVLRHRQVDGREAVLEVLGQTGDRPPRPPGRPGGAVVGGDGVPCTALAALRGTHISSTIWLGYRTSWRMRQHAFWTAQASALNRD